MGRRGEGEVVVVVVGRGGDGYTLVASAPAGSSRGPESGGGAVTVTVVALHVAWHDADVEEYEGVVRRLVGAWGGASVPANSPEKRTRALAAAFLAEEERLASEPGEERERRRRRAATSGVDVLWLCRSLGSKAAAEVWWALKSGVAIVVHGAAHADSFRVARGLLRLSLGASEPRVLRPASVSWQHLGRDTDEAVIASWAGDDDALATSTLGSGSREALLLDAGLMRVHVKHAHAVPSDSAQWFASLLQSAQSEADFVSSLAER